MTKVKILKKIILLTACLLLLSISVSYALPFNKVSLRAPVGQKELYERIDYVNGNIRYFDLTLDEFESMSREDQILAFLPMVRYIALGKLKYKPIPYHMRDDKDKIEELIGAGTVALIKLGVDGFEREKCNGKPATYLAVVIHSAMLNHIRELTRYETGSTPATLKKYNGTGLINGKNNLHLENFDEREPLTTENMESLDEAFLYKLEKLEKLIKFLTPSQQAAFILYYYGGLKGDKLANALGVSRTQSSNLINDAKKRIQGNEKAKTLFREVVKIGLDLDLRTRVTRHFSGVLRKEIKRQKRDFNRGKAYDKRTTNLGFVKIKEQDIPELSKRVVKGKEKNLEAALRAYMEITEKLEKIEIDTGFNYFLDIVSALVVTGTRKEGMYRLLNRVNDKSLANPFMTDYRKEKGLNLEDIDESEISALLDKFPMGKTKRNKLERVFEIYIAHAKLMRRLGINKGRTLSEDIISAFIRVTRESRDVTKKDVIRKVKIVSDEKFMRNIYRMVKRMENGLGLTDIFAATPQEEGVFSKTFQKELTGGNLSLNLMTAAGQKLDLRTSL